MPGVDAIQSGPAGTPKSSSGSLFAYTAGDSSSEQPNNKPVAAGDEQDRLMADDDPLTSSMKASNISKPAKAHILKHPSRTIPRGTAIPCILKTRIDTSRPGLVVCDSKEEVRGWNGGTVMLLPRWTRFTGQISHGLTVDQDRADVLWTSVLTPDNIEITINSPATDMLGAPGVPGQVDNHIGEKIGAVLLYTAIEAGPALAVQALQNQSNNGSSYSPYSYNQVFQPGQGVAGRLLEQKLQRPPILVKNQGEEVMVMVAQNWDLSDVIALEPVR
jgi:type IV secretion system protein VirB10